MSYELQAILISARYAAGVSELRRCGEVHLVELRGGILMVPMTDELFDAIDKNAVSEKRKELWKYSDAIEQWLMRIAVSGVVAYVEAEYFGGAGTQSAIVFNQGAIVYGPAEGGRQIDEALKLLGVKAEPGLDEFDSVGLGRFRRMDQWIDRTL